MRNSVPRASMIFCLVSTVLTVVAASARGDDPKAEVPPAKRLTTKSGVSFGIWPQVPDRPAPTLFIFATTVEGTLDQEVYRKAGNILAPRGYLCVAVDLPCHGPERRTGEPDGLAGWRYRSDQGEDFMADLTSRCKAVVDHLIEVGWTDPEKLAACGTSRGGFSALHFAAAEPRVKCVAAYSPVTELTALSEFGGEGTRHPIVAKLAIHEYGRQLAGRGVWIIIGDRDARVDTDHAIRLARQLTMVALEQGQPALVDLHVLSQPNGHTVPDGAAEQSAEWIERMLAGSK